jgi:hypothetical protein
MKLHESIQPGWGDAANYFCERDKMYETTELNVLAVVNLQTNKIAAAPDWTTFGDVTESHDTGVAKLQTPQQTSRPGSGFMRIGSAKPHTLECILSPSPIKKLNLSASKKTQPVQPRSFYPCILPPEQIIT